MKSVRALIARLKGAYADQDEIGRSMVTVASFVLIAAVARVGAEMAIAYRYGVSAEVDAYLFVLNLIRWPISVWQSVLTVVLVPITARLMSGCITAASTFRSELLGLTIIIAGVFFVIGWLGLPSFLRTSWPGLPEHTALLAQEMVPILAWLAPLGIFVGLFFVRLLAVGSHIITLLEGVTAIVLLLAIVNWPDSGVGPLLWGTLVGFVVHLSCLALLGVKSGQWILPSFSLKSHYWPEFWKGFGIMLMGQILMSFTAVVDQFFAASLDTGAVAALNYATRMLAFPLGLGAVAISRATLPIFSTLESTTEHKTYLRAQRWAVTMLVIGIFVMIIGWFTAGYFVKLFLERGAFSAQDTTSVAHVLEYGLVQIPFYFSAIVLTSYFASRGFYTLLFYSGLFALFSKVLLNTLLAPQLGVGGIAMATSLMYALNFVFFWLALAVHRSKCQV